MSGHLLDSNVLLWWLSADERLGRAGWLDRIERMTDATISLATPWELWIKASTGRLPLPVGFDTALEGAKFRMLIPTLADARLATHLPLLHRDPFDRMIIAQALNRQMTIITSDRFFAQYGVETILV